MMQPADGLALRSGQEDDYRRDSIESDEKRLAELGRKTVEMLVISHIITEKMEVGSVTWATAVHEVCGCTNVHALLPF